MKSFKNDDKVQLDLTTVDNHAFAIMGAFKKHARRQGFDESEIEAVLEEAMKGDYQHLLATIINHCEV